MALLKLQLGICIFYSIANINILNGIHAFLKNDKYEIHYFKNWPNANITFGQLSAVALDNEGNVVIFNRGTHIWNNVSFSMNNTYLHINEGPIHDDTVIFLNSTTGNLVQSWGRDRFYMPHGLTIDYYNNIWLTDVALHQVFKYDSTGTDILLVLGVKFEPGGDKSHFCKPTSVAVLPNGDFFVADGYCNSRIVKYSKSGSILMEIGTSGMNMFSTSQKSVYSLSVPHALVAVDGTNEICVADREHGRIVCYNYYSGVYTSMFKFLDITGSRLFSLAYSAIDGGKFYVVNGPEPYSLNPVRGFVINIPNRTVEASFSPDYGDFKNPHDVAVNALGNWIYVVELNPMKVHKFKAMFKRNFTVKAARVEVADDSVLRVSDTSGGTSGSLSYTTGQIVLIALIVIIVLCGVPALLYLTVWKNKVKRKYGKLIGDNEETIETTLFSR